MGSALAACGGGGTEPRASVASVVVSGAPASGVLLIEAPLQLTAIALDAGGTALTRPITWSSSEPGIATVSASGLVVGMQPGEVTISALSEGLVGTALFSVRAGIAVPPAGAAVPITTTVLGGAVRVTVPPGAAGTAIALHVRPATSAPANDRILPGTSFEFGPTGAVFNSPVTLSLRYDATGRTQEEQNELRIYRIEGNTLTLIPGGTADTANKRIIAQVDHFSSFTVAKPATPASMTLVAGAGQSGPLGSTVPVSPVFLVRDANGAPVPFAVVYIEPARSEYTGAQFITSGEDGLVTVGAWTLPYFPGPATLTAHMQGVSLPPVTVTATAVSPAGVNLFLSESPGAIASGVGIGFPVWVDLSNRGALDVAQLAIEVSWDPALFVLNGIFPASSTPWRDPQGGLVTITADSSQAALQGRLTLSGSAGAATTSSFQIVYLNFFFRQATTFQSTIDAVVLSATNAAGAPITVTPRNISIVANPP